ncbi:MAG: phage holin family protein [Candidatus Spyradosoma sp.]
MNEQKILHFFRDALIIAFGVLFAAVILGPTHIRYANFLSLFVVAVFISLLNAFLRPLLISFALPLLLTAFGLGAAGTGLFRPRSLFGALALFVSVAVFGLWIVNACIFSLASLFAGGSFVVNGFGSAMLGSVFTSLATLLICAFFGIRRRSLFGDLLRRGMAPRSGDDAGAPPPPPPSPRRRAPRERDDDVIDI